MKFKAEYTFDAALDSLEKNYRESGDEDRALLEFLRDVGFPQVAERWRRARTEIGFWCG